MVNNLTPNRPPDSRGEVPNSHKTTPRPTQPPRDDQFRKTYKDKNRLPTKEEEEEEVASIGERDQEEVPSLFDLSKKSSVKKPSRQPTNGKKQFAGPKETISEQDQEMGLGEYFEGSENISGKPQKKLGETAPFVTDEDLPEQLPEQMLSDVPVYDQSGESKPLEKEIKLSQDSTRMAEVNRESVIKSKKPETPTIETKKGPEKEKSKGTARSVGEQERASEGAVVNPSLQSVAFQTEKAQEPQEAARSATIKDLAAQIIDRIQVMRKGDETSTFVTLRHPPILEGATLTLTTSDNAKREFNISFSNLSPDAKLFLDRKLNEDSLTQTLERKGIVVHMISTTTQADTVINVETGQTFRERQEQQPGQQQKRQQQSEEEET